MKRRIKTERIIILLLSLIVMVLAIFLLIVLHSNKNCSCNADAKNDLASKDKLVCGDDNDISRFMCNRFHMDGYIVTFKNNIEENEKYNILNQLMMKLQSSPAMFVNKDEVNNVLRSMYGLQDEKDFGIDSFIFIPDDGHQSIDNIKSTVKDIKELDKIIQFKVKEESNEKK